MGWSVKTVMLLGKPGGGGNNCYIEFVIDFFCLETKKKAFSLSNEGRLT